VYIVHVPGNNEVILFQHSTSNMNQFVQDKGTQGLSADERAKVWNLFFFLYNYVFYTIATLPTVLLSVQFFKTHNITNNYSQYMENGEEIYW